MLTRHRTDADLQAINQLGRVTIAARTAVADINIGTEPAVDISIVSI